MAEILEIEKNLALRIKVTKNRKERRYQQTANSNTKPLPARTKISSGLKRSKMLSGLSSEAKKLELGIPS
jgi:hypothetical protein